MGNKLLIRAYNVGCGDCIYVRIPNAKNGFHILIDCGKKGDDVLLEKAIKHLEGELPSGSTAAKKRLDLLVATHRHEDHIKGFDPRWFKNIEVKNIWLSVVMDPEHRQATGVQRLHALATTAMRSLVERSHSLSPEIELLASMYGVSNDKADDVLKKTLPDANDIEAKYVHAGWKHGLKLPPDTAIHILAPELDVDHFYLGEDVDTELKRVRGFTDTSRPGVAGAATGADQRPSNISETDFRVLQSRMLSNGLAFAAKDTSIQNNLSVVLLIEWKKRRLLFVGDAEWEGEYKVGKHNGSWNVMWEKYRKTHLKAPLDFLKIGHHGSINSTPPPAETRAKSKKAIPNGVHTILDSILPVPKNGAKPTAQAIVSTEREFYNPIPQGSLLVDLARRVRNTRNYGQRLAAKGIDPTTVWVTTKAKRYRFFENYEKEFLQKPQPLRTDLEFVAEGKPYIDVEIAPG